jgi:sigma-B regulation protein RsbU (phosphoserine phosphatase)
LGDFGASAGLYVSFYAFGLMLGIVLFLGARNQDGGDSRNRLEQGDHFMGSNEKNTSALLQPLRVLLLEDNPGDVRLIQELLIEASAPFQLEAVGRLSEARSRLENGSYNLILVDLSLPDSHGIETFHTVAALAPHTPLIVLSGLDDEMLALQTVQEGAQDYLVKGHVDHYTLVRAMRYAIKRAEADRALAEERNLLRNVIDNLYDSIYVKDAEGHYLLDNLAHMRSLGISSPEQVLGKTVFDFFPAPVAAKFQEDDQAVIRTGNPIINREEVVVADAATVRWVSTTKVPLRNEEGKTVGVVGIGRDITERKRAEEQLFRYNAEIRQRNAEMEDDLHMAREIQQAFLPQQYPLFPKHSAGSESAIRFFSRYIPTTAVGGDFFHVLPISEKEAGVFICDVMGHGVRAALVTAIQRALVEEMSPIAHDPGRFLTEINRSFLSILRRARTPMFASAFYLVVDAETMQLRYANAGHPRPLHVHRKAQSVTFLSPERQGPALGVFKDVTYSTKLCPVESGDLVILFTDGLFEVEGDNNAYFNLQMLLETVCSRVGAPAEVLIEETVGEIQNFAANHTFVDDVCLVGVEVEQMMRPAE